jgi:hypothetical protein
LSKRGQHDALDALVTGLKRKKVSIVLDADVRGCFDAISHGWLVKFIEHRIADKRVLRLIQKWLNAGVVEDGKWLPALRPRSVGPAVEELEANGLEVRWIPLVRKRHPWPEARFDATIRDKNRMR